MMLITKVHHKMKTEHLRRERCLPGKKQIRSCHRSGDVFDNLTLIKGEEWKSIRFENDDADLSSVLIVAKTEPEPFEGFYVRRWDHPYEPNFETRTYNLLEFCQQKKVKGFFETGRAGNLIVWTRDEKTKRPYVTGAFERLQKLRRIKGYDRGALKPRTALRFAEAYVLPYENRIPMRDFEDEFRERNLAFPSVGKMSPYHSCYGNYVIDKTLTKVIMDAIKKNAVKSEVYGNIGELHTIDMARKQKEISQTNRNRKRKIDVDKFRKRFTTKQEIEHARIIGIL